MGRGGEKPFWVIAGGQLGCKGDSGSSLLFQSNLQLCYGCLLIKMRTEEDVQKLLARFSQASIPPMATSSLRFIYTPTLQLPPMASLAPILRPTSCWKTILRRSRQQKMCIRCLSTFEPPIVPLPPPPRLPSSYPSPFKLSRGIRERMSFFLGNMIL